MVSAVHLQQLLQLHPLLAACERARESVLKISHRGYPRWQKTTRMPKIESVISCDTLATVPPPLQQVSCASCCFSGLAQTAGLKCRFGAGSPAGRAAATTRSWLLSLKLRYDRVPSLRDLVGLSKRAKDVVWAATDSCSRPALRPQDGRVSSARVRAAAHLRSAAAHRL